MDCSICVDVVVNGRVAPTCGHVFCRDCLLGLAKSDDKNAECPECKCKLDMTELVTLAAVKETLGLVEIKADEIPSFSLQPRDIKEKYEWINRLSKVHKSRISAREKKMKKSVDFNQERANYSASKKIEECIDDLKEHLRNVIAGKVVGEFFFRVFAYLSR